MVVVRWTHWIYLLMVICHDVSGTLGSFMEPEAASTTLKVSVADDLDTTGRG